MDLKCTEYLVATCQPKHALQNLAAFDHPIELRQKALYHLLDQIISESNLHT